LEALQAFGERRRKARVSIPDARVELLDGDRENEPMFAGALRDLSSTGIGLETDRQIPDEAVRVRLSLPGTPESIESKARVMWQQPVDDQSNRYYCGCRLLGLPEAARSRISQLIEHAHT
ncbi:MAG: PilZ domain-containing protein, partial [Candidatus Omnitrophica bacterium]|nr:PilZ domain-containing protein [Candidatus Omnitrophota bacterium]